MKIAIISDIHGNEYALDAVTMDISEQKADIIFVLGDIISDFSHMTNSVLHKVKNLSNFVIQGNREGYMLSQNRGDFGEIWSEYKQFSTNLKTWQALSPEDIQYISLLPKQLSLLFDDTFSLRMVHGSPFSEFDCIKDGADDLMVRSLAAINEKILLCGHTHRSMIKEIDDKIIINVGSVGFNFDKDFISQYTLISYTGDKINIDMRKVPYDFMSLKKSCDMSDTWIRLCLKSMEDGINYNTRFLKEAQDLCKCYPITNNAWDSLTIEWERKGIIPLYQEA